jgi:hypothetical protein
MSEERVIFTTTASAAGGLFAFTTARDGGPMPWYFWLIVAVAVCIAVIVLLLVRTLRRPMTEMDERLGRVDAELEERGQ